MEGQRFGGGLTRWLAMRADGPAGIKRHVVPERRQRVGRGGPRQPGPRRRWCAVVIRKEAVAVVADDVVAVALVADVVGDGGVEVCGGWCAVCCVQALLLWPLLSMVTALWLLSCSIIYFNCCACKNKNKGNHPTTKQ